jgi:thiol-disulfide isomerase/thioredoxin
MRNSLLCALSLGASLAGVARAEVKSGDRAAELVNIKDRQQKKLTLRSYQGKQIVVLTFGASWCKPCRKELPAYDRIARRYQKAKAPVVFVAVNIDSERANADHMIDELGGLKSLRIGFDPQGGAVETYEPGTMPTTYIIDQNGLVRDVHAGFEKGDEEEVAKRVDALLAKAAK